jgi:hypothetical protein
MTNAALLACLLSGWPAAEDCHKKLVEKGPKAVAEVKKGLLEALADDPGLAPREHNNRVALTSSAGRRGKGHPDSARLKKAVSAAEELGRLGEWRHLRRLGTVTAAEGLGKMEDPPVEALRTLTAWASEPKQRRRQLAAAYSLKWYGPKAQPVVPELIVMLRDPDTRLAALETLERIGPGAAPAVPELGKLLKYRGWSNGAYSTLLKIKTPEAERLIDENPRWTVAP